MSLLIGSVALLYAQDTEPPRPGLDAPRVRIAVGEFRAIGGTQTAAADISNRLRRALSAGSQIQVIAGEEPTQVLAESELDILAQKPGAARALGDKLGVDAVVYGRLVTNVSSLVDDPVAVKAPFVQIVVAETLTLEGGLSPSMGFLVATGDEFLTRLEAETVSLLPAAGRVLAIIDSPEGVAIQLFPVGGRVLAPKGHYGVYDPVGFRAAVEDPGGLSDALARQELRPGVLTGQVRTASEPDGHAIFASSLDPQGKITVGQLVGLPPAAGARIQTPQLPLLIVNAQPADSVVLLDGQLAGVAPVAVPLKAGNSAKVTVAKADFFPVTHEILAAPTDALALGVALKEIPPFGGLRVASAPQGAMVSLDGKELGVTPLDAKKVPAGDHELSLALTGYQPSKRDIRILRQRTAELSVELQKDLRAIRIVSAPDGARVAINGDAAGVTPLDIASIQTGEHKVRLTLPGHAITTETMAVDTTTDEQLFSYRLRPLAGNIRVETTPPGAAVTVDGDERGKSPLALTGLSIGQHKIGLASDGHLSVTKTVTVQDQQTTTLKETLTRAEGQLICVSVPTGAKITLDGKEVGVTPKTITEVPVGKRVVTLYVEGYQPWTGRAPIVHGETTKVEVGLIRVGPNLRRTP